MTLARTARSREGFTLVELLTVIGIISLLISILLPSLSKARDQAKKVRVQAQISAVEKGLEMFQNDFQQYPDSAEGIDPINWNMTWSGSTNPPQPTNGAYMTGAHWLARAMIGHDFQGVDVKGTMLQRAPTTTPTVNLSSFNDPDVNGTPNTAPGVNSERKGSYLDPKVFVRDDDGQKFPGVPAESDGKTIPNVGRIIVQDGYNFPLLYYRASSRAKNPFGDGATVQGVYNQSDNAEWTGGTVNLSGTATTVKGWDFAASGSAHGIGQFGGSAVLDYTNGTTGLALLDVNASGSDGGSPAKNYKGKTFINYFHSESTHQAGNVAKSVNPDTFILISAGKDGIYGTSDDVTNFGSGGL